MNRIVLSTLSVCLLFASTMAHTAEIVEGASLPKVNLPAIASEPVLPDAMADNPTQRQNAAQTSEQTSTPTNVSVTRTGDKSSVKDLSIAPEAPVNASGKVSVTSDNATSQEKNNTAYVVGSILSGTAVAFDGHSFLLNGKYALRLNGVDAPGLEQICATPEGQGWRCGLEAKQRLSQYLDGERVDCVVIEALAYGAAAACSTSQTDDVAKMLVFDGYAVPNTFSKGRYNGEKIVASQNRKGLWVGQFMDPATWRSRHN